MPRKLTFGSNPARVLRAYYKEHGIDFDPKLMQKLIRFCERPVSRFTLDSIQPADKPKAVIRFTKDRAAVRHEAKAFRCHTFVRQPKKTK